MFSPGTRKPNPSSGKGCNLSELVTLPFTYNRTPISNRFRPINATPAPRATQAKKTQKGDDSESIQPVHISEFPKVVRDEQVSFIQKNDPSNSSISGGIDKETSSSWVLCGSKLFIWNTFSPAASRKCVSLKLPSESEDIQHKVHQVDSWLLNVVNWDNRYIGIVLCNKKTRALIYWPDIYSESGISSVPIHDLPDESEVMSVPGDGKNNFKMQRYRKQEFAILGTGYFTSMIVSVIPEALHTCVALVCSTNGELWQFHCSPTEILRSKVYQDVTSLSSKSSQVLEIQGYPRSLNWRVLNSPSDGYSRQFFLLTDHDIQCFRIELSNGLKVSKIWFYEIICPDSNLALQKDLTFQNQTQPLDFQEVENGKTIIILVAIICKGDVSGSSYTKYLLLTLQYKAGFDDFESKTANHIPRDVLEKKSVQVIIQKARVEEENFLFSMKLRVGGKPPGSVIILSGDGMAIISHFWSNSTKFYQFNLPYDFGKVLDASVFCSSDDSGNDAWIVLTEKAGIWAIPEKAILLGRDEPLEHNLLSTGKGSLNEGPTQERKRNHSPLRNIVHRTTSFETSCIGYGQNAELVGFPPIEESEALLGHTFRDFLISGQVNGALEKLQKSGAFESGEEANVFVRESKSIVDALAKHWTTTRDAEIVGTAVLSTQLIDKQQKHQRFIQFLALSKCHEELCSKKKHSLQTIMEHGEKLASMIQLRELQNIISQSRSSKIRSPYSTSDSGAAGSLWDVIQFVGDKARRNTVLLMDRDNSEVFYSKVSDLEDFFYCLDCQIEYIVSENQPFLVQIQRVCELSNACMTLVRTAMQYKNEHHVWYPSPDCLTPWYSQLVVCSGIWSVASLMLRMLNKVTDASAKSEMYAFLEELVEILLEAYTSAITAKVEREEDHRGLLEEYWNRRDALLDGLYQQVNFFAKAGYEGLHEGDEQNQAMSKELSSHLLSIAKRHEGYQTLWKICSDHNDSALLKNLMHDSMGPKGGFSDFVFRQLFENQQFPKLLRIGEEFQEGLSTFLKRHTDLLWLHELFIQQFSSASETLHELSLSQNSNAISAVEDGKDPEFIKHELTLKERRHLLNLSKIAAIAGKNSEHEIKTKRIEADLKILLLQEEIVSALPEGKEKQDIGQRLLPPWDLIELCLNSQRPELVLRAFDVFAWTSSSFRKHNRSLLEECWKIAAVQNDWARLYETWANEGWSEEETLRILGETVLFQASRRCYGPEAETFEVGFEDALRMRSAGDCEDEEASHSVEGILMQHKDFLDAGNLMLTAINLGGVEIDVGGGGGICSME